MSKSINDSSIDLDKFLASKVRQLAKKMEASKATVCHIKQVASDPQAGQINLMRQQWTDHPPSKNKRKAFKSRPPSHKQHTLNSAYNKKYVEIFLHYRQLFVKGNVFIGEWEIFVGGGYPSL